MTSLRLLRYPKLLSSGSDCYSSVCKQFTLVQVKSWPFNCWWKYSFLKISNNNYYYKMREYNNAKVIRLFCFKMNFKSCVVASFVMLKFELTNCRWKPGPINFKSDVHAIGHGNIGFCCKECITFQQQKSHVLTRLYKGSWIWNIIFRLFIELDVSAC